MRLVFAGLILCLCASAVFADPPAKPIPVETFFSYPKLTNVKISPDGQHLALAMSGDANGFVSNELVILGTTDMKPKAQMKVETANVTQSILNYWWVND